MPYGPQEATVYDLIHDSVGLMGRGLFVGRKVFR